MSIKRELEVKRLTLIRESVIGTRLICNEFLELQADILTGNERLSHLVEQRLLGMEIERNELISAHHEHMHNLSVTMLEQELELERKRLDLRAMEIDGRRLLNELHLANRKARTEVEAMELSNDRARVKNQLRSEFLNGLIKEMDSRELSTKEIALLLDWFFS